MTDDVSVSNVFKGEGFGRTSCYTLSSGIKLGEAGVCGVSHAIGVYKQSGCHWVSPSRWCVRLRGLTSRRQAPAT
jgi:hypothetical protein